MIKVVMNQVRLDDNSVVINFDKFDVSNGELVGEGGYTHVRQESDAYSITVFDCDGEVVSETRLPFKFKNA